METHAVATTFQDEFIKELKQKHADRSKIPGTPFSDPLKEFSTSSNLAGTVRTWLTLSIPDRKKRIVKMGFTPRFMGDEAAGLEPENKRLYDMRHLEEWRALCVVIQEESRAEAGNRSPEVAIAALKFLFPEHPFQK